MQSYDILVIGGGINGAGIARDAAGRGLRVLLCEKHDLAGATSSSSTKLIHGGLRYLEYYEFRLVREALKERERLLAIAPHIVWPLRFVLPHTAGLRPRWLLRIGLFLYDHLARLKSLPGSAAVALRGSPYGAPLRPDITTGFVYSDCWVEDSRLVVLNAMDAAVRGAEMRTRTAVVAARRVAGRWQATLREAAGAEQEVSAGIVVNAAGPWVSETLGGTLGVDAKAAVRLVKGSHIVTRRLYEGEHAYIFQNPDGRIVFAIPYEREFTLIGTTDVPHEAAPGPVTISPEETAYLCESVDRFLKRRVTPDDVVWSYSGVRPLFDDAAENASAVTRDYVLDVHDAGGAAPVLSVFGGKITTYRRLAEHALEKLAPYLPQGLAPAWTADTPLPGGAMPNADFERWYAWFRAEKPFLPERSRAPAGARLRHAGAGDPRRGEDPRRPRRGFRRGADARRGRLPRGARMGARGGRHPVAPLQARPAPVARSRRSGWAPISRRPRQLDEKGGPFTENTAARRRKGKRRAAT